jgi:hypothetical protein
MIIPPQSVGSAAPVTSAVRQSVGSLAKAPTWAIALGALALVGIAAVVVAPRLIPGLGGGPVDGRTVGTSHGYRMVDNGDGTQTWAETDGTLQLGRHRGAAEGYATLQQALAATHPNAPDTDDMAFLRDSAAAPVQAYSLTGQGLDRYISFTATHPQVVAYTSPESGDVFAGPAASADDRAANGLVDRN